MSTFSTEAAADDTTAGAGAGLDFTTSLVPDQRGNSWVEDFTDANYANRINAPAGTAAVAGIGETFALNTHVRCKLGVARLAKQTMAVYKARVMVASGSSKCYWGFIDQALAGTAFPGSAPKGVYLERDASDNLIFHINDGTTDKTQTCTATWPGDDYHDIIVYASASDKAGAGSVWGSIDGQPLDRYFVESGWPTVQLAVGAASKDKAHTISKLGKTSVNREQP